MSFYKSPSSQKAFTLIELLIVIGILAILATVVLLVINPAQLIKQTRDANRLTELNQIDKALALFESFGGTNMGLPNNVYVSIPCDQADFINLPALSPGYVYACSSSANFRKTNGSGWLPVDLTSIQSQAGNLFSALPIDPINIVAGGLYYTYIKGSWALSAAMESERYLASNTTNDGGQVLARFEMGNNLALNANLTPPSSVTVTAISPNSGYNNASVSLTSITGTGFVAGATVKLTKASQSDITCTGTTVASATSITGGSCPITGAITGAWNVVVTNTDTGSGTLSNGFTISAPWACGDVLIDTRDNKTYTTALIGAQCWFKQNINVGTITAGANTQGTSCSSIQKYCYSDTESICTSDGALYQWDQAMCGSITAGSQGICPTGWHIPTHDEWTTLERSVCASGTCTTDFPYDITTLGWRGTNEHSKLSTFTLGGTNSSGFTIILAGARDLTGGFFVRTSSAFIWSSVQSGGNAWRRYLRSDFAGVDRNADLKAYGFSVRCLKN